VAIQYRSSTTYRNAYRYDGTGGAGGAAQTFAARARICIVQTLSARTRVRKLDLATFSSKAWITGDQRFSVRARVSRRQGWPIPDTDDPYFEMWQDTRLYGRANLTNYLALTTQTIRIKGRVTYSQTLALTAKARIVTAQTLQIRANIVPRFLTTHLPVSFRVQETAQRKLRVVFCTEGYSRNRTFTVRARIQQSYSYRVTGHFIVPTATATSTVISVLNPIVNARLLQPLSIRTRICK
jgi:hypothetical protein